MTSVSESKEKVHIPMQDPDTMGSESKEEEKVHIPMQDTNTMASEIMRIMKKYDLKFAIKDTCTDGMLASYFLALVSSEQRVAIMAKEYLPDGVSDSPLICAQHCENIEEAVRECFGFELNAYTREELVISMMQLPISIGLATAGFTCPIEYRESVRDDTCDCRDEEMCFHRGPYVRMSFSRHSKGFSTEDQMHFQLDMSKETHEERMADVCQQMIYELYEYCVSMEMQIPPPPTPKNNSTS